MLENEIELYLVRQVRKAKGQIRKLKFIGHRGAPDRLVWVPIWIFPVLVELKAPGVAAEDHQLREHKRLRKIGFRVVVIDNKQDIDRLLSTAMMI